MEYPILIIAVAGCGVTLPFLTKNVNTSAENYELQRVEETGRQQNFELDCIVKMA